MAGIRWSGNGRERGMKVDTAAKRESRLRLAKLVAGFVTLLVLGVMTSGALADGDPFAPLTALTGTTSSSTSSDTTGAPSTSTSDSTTTDAATSTDAATTDATTTDSTTDS